MNKNISEYELREEFKNILYELAEEVLSIDSIKDLCIKLDSLYTSKFETNSELIEIGKNNNKFRHYYSDILNVLININHNRPYKGDILNIAQNVDTILSCESCEIKSEKEIKKLYDHLNLEICRLTYMESITQEQSKLTKFRYEISKNITKYNENVEKMREEIDNISEKNKELELKVISYQKESITILGIFTSIVVTIVGGGYFSSLTLGNLTDLKKENIYVLISIFLILSIIIFNILITLYYFIIKIVEIRKNGFKDSFKEYLYLFIPNIILILLLLISFNNIHKFN